MRADLLELLGELADEVFPGDFVELPDEPEAQAEALAALIVGALRRLELDNQTPRGRLALGMLLRAVNRDVADHVLEALL